VSQQLYQILTNLNIFALFCAFVQVGIEAATADVEDTFSGDISLDNLTMINAPCASQSSPHIHFPYRLEHSTLFYLNFIRFD